MVCALCEIEKGSYRTCYFGGVAKDLCSDCLLQWKVQEKKVTKHSVVLYDRYTH